MDVDISSSSVMPDIDRSMPGMDVKNNFLHKKFEPGDVILNRYVVESLLGEGGMGVVYKCKDETSGTICALKTLHLEFVYNNQDLENIRSNFRLVHNLHHDNIASYNSLEYDSSRNMFYLIMEYVEGVTISDYLKKMRGNGSFSERMVIDLCKKIAAALDFAHAHKVLHCDIKPSNIMIDKNNNVKIVDFGLAVANHTTISYVDNSSLEFKGTLNYMAPEQWRCEKCCEASDQYSLAVTVYEIFSGKVPFYHAPNRDLLRQCVLKEKPAHLKDVSPAISYAVNKAMNKYPSKRYKSCSEFVVAMERNIMLEALKSSMVLSWNFWLKTKKNLKDSFLKIIQLPWMRFFAILFVFVVLLMLGGKLFLDWEFFWGDVILLPGFLLLFYGAIKIVKFRGKAKFIGVGVLFLLYIVAQVYCNSLTCKALHGDVYAMTRLAEEAEDPRVATGWYKDAAEKGDSYAQYRYAVFLLTRQNEYQKAFQWFGAAANQNLARAQYELGNCYYNGKGTAKDPQNAVCWWKKSAAQGVNDAFDAVVKEYTLKNQLIELEAFVKNKSVQEQGKIFYKGGIYWQKQKDNECAAKWFEKGYKIEEPLSTFELAMLYRLGSGVEHNHVKALNLFEKACDLNVKKAPFYCGDYYECGAKYGLEVNYDKACRRYKDGVELKDPQAMLRWADVVYYGKWGVEQNLNYAFELYSELQNSNLVDAIFKLGLCYWNGHGCKQDKKEAGELFKKAVEKCPENGEYWFYWGLYCKKANFDQDYIKKVFKKAYDLGCNPAKEYLE